MKILVTGSNGFIGKNLITELRNLGYTNIFEYDKETDRDKLKTYTKEADFVFHLAGANRPTNEEDFEKDNVSFTEEILEELKYNKNFCPIMLASSIHVNRNDLYGKTKRISEELLFEYEKETGVKVLIYRFTNVFGKWCKPNYNSVIATFCHNIANSIPIIVNDPTVKLDLLYIDDLVKELVNALEGNETKNGRYCEVKKVYTESLGEIARLLSDFKESRKTKLIPNMNKEFVKKLYSTYLSYLPKDEFSYSLKMNEDERGSFTEFIKTKERGQVSINISKPKIIKGNHWHHTKNEKFLVVSGKGVVRFRKIDSDEIIEYYVSGEKLEVIDIPVGYTHNIENLGDTDMVTIMWANESYDPKNPDTYYLEV